MKNNFFYKCLLISFSALLIMQIDLAAQQDSGLSQGQRTKQANDHYLRGKQFLQQGDYASANQEFKRAQAILNTIPLESTTSTSVSPAESLPEKSQVEEKSWAVKAEESAKSGKAEEAIQYYLKAIAQNAKDPHLYYNLAVEYLQTKKFKEATSTLKQLVQLDPKDIDALYNLGVIYDNYLKDEKQALSYYLRYIKLAPQAEDAVQVRQWIKEIRNRHDE